MPYITEGKRILVDECGPIDSGELNYAITKTVLDYLHDRIEMPNYAAMNSVVGVLECVKQEFYRRAVVPYEEAKIKENGDVY
jgi:hypothetical protein